MNSIKQYIHGWNRNLILLAMGVFAVGAFFGVQLTLINNYMVDRIGVEPHELGIIEGLREVPGFMNVIFIALMMRLSPPLVAGGCLVVMGLGIAGYAAIESVVLFTLLSMIWSIGFHCWVPLEQSLVILYSPGKKKGVWLGRMRSVNGFAWILMIIACHFLFPVLDYNGFFIIAGVVTVLGGIAVAFAADKRPREKEKAFLLKKRYRLFYALQFLQGCRKQMFITFAIFAMVMVHGMPVETTIILVLINQVLVTLTAPFMGRLVDRYGERKTLSWSYVGLFFVFMGYAFVTHRPSLYVLYCIDNLLFVGGIALTTYVHKIAPESELKPTLSMGVTWNHVASVLAPLLAGFAWKYFGYQIIFVSGAILALVSLGVSQWMDPEGLLAREKAVLDDVVPGGEEGHI